MAAVAVVGGLAVVGLGVVMGLFFCGGGLVVVALAGLCAWGLWIVFGLVRVSLLFLHEVVNLCAD